MKVKLWNDNVHDFKTKLNDTDLTIKAKSYVELERFEANDIRGRFHGMKLQADGTQDPKTYQMLRIELPTDTPSSEEVDLLSHVCMVCSKGYESEPVLKAHLATEHGNESKLELPEVDEEIKKRGRPKKAS